MSQITVKDLEIIKNCQLFESLSPEETKKALTFFKASAAEYKKGEILNRIGSPFPFFGLNVSGVIQVSCDDIDGNRVIMATVLPKQTFGESLCFLGKENDNYVTSVTDTRIIKLYTDNLSVNGIESDFEKMLVIRFISMLADRTLSMNSRIQILSKQSLRQKLIMLFSQYSIRPNIEFNLPFDRKEMAVYLGSDRSSLSRELGKMKREGIIDFNKNRFVIK